MNTNKIEISYSKSGQILLCIGGIVFLSIGFFLLVMALKTVYIQVMVLLFGLLFLFFGILVTNAATRKIGINREGIYDKTWLRKRLFKKENVLGYAEVVLPSSKEKSTQLVIFSKDKKRIKLSPENWGKDYSIFLKKLRLNYSRADSKEKGKLVNQHLNLYKNIGKGFGVFLVLMGLFQLIFQDIILIKNTIEIQQTLANAPIFKKKSRRNNGKMTLFFDEQPAFHFQVSNHHLNLLHPAIKDLQRNDVISITILKKDAAEKLERAVSTAYIHQNMPANWAHIELYGIKKDGQTLLEIEAINEHRINPFPKLFLILFGIAFFLYFQFVSKGYD